MRAWTVRMASATVLDMDTRLVAWARAVKSRHRRTARALPPLWLFTDAARMDVLRSVRSLPAGLCGVVFRGGPPGLAHQVWLACRARRLALVSVVSRPGPGAGRHLRRGRGRADGFATASAHGPAELVRARRAGAAAAFLSPVFPTRSHQGAPALGPVVWAGLTRRAGLPVLALGGVDGIRVRRLPRWVRGIGAVGALAS